jgi:hypothetical protein
VISGASSIESISCKIATRPAAEAPPRK